MSKAKHEGSPGEGAPDSEESDRGPSLNFVEQIVVDDVKKGKNGGRVHTRFPPEPNGYLHIGHAKAFSVNFMLAENYDGLCNLRFDDTNPAKEDTEFVDAIQEDIHWLGFDWGDRLYYASDYFARLFEMAEQLIEKGVAFVCDLTADEVREYRGTATRPGRNSPNRDRTVEENLDLFRRMRAGEFEDGSRTLRAKIDMASPNFNLRDPVMYRITRSTHHRTGDEWCIYPTYDWAHGQSDSIEGITHSCCSLEFENHRPLYDWFLDQLEVECHPQQIEFARLILAHTVLSKRKLLQLVTEGLVDGWTDPRMPTLRGMRRRGYTPEAIRDFIERVGVAKYNSVVDIALLENSLRNDLNQRTPRAMGVLRPLKVVITNYPDGEEMVDAVNNPEDKSAGTRSVPFSKELYIERDDFMADPPKKFFRLSVGREVRLRYAYYVTCTGFETDPESGEVVEVHCEYDPESRGGSTPDGRKVKGTIHWVSARHAFEAEVRLYDHLFAKADPNEVEGDGTFLDNLNPESLVRLTNCRLEPSLKSARPGERFQFERNGYFCVDPDSVEGAPVFNRTVTLRDTWAKIMKKANQAKQAGKAGA